MLFIFSLNDVSFPQVLSHCDTVEQKKNISLKQAEERRKAVITAEQKNRPSGKGVFGEMLFRESDRFCTLCVSMLYWTVHRLIILRYPRIGVSIFNKLLCRHTICALVVIMGY